VDRLVASPSAKSLAAARDAWLRACVPCQQTEAFRFGNKIVDEWEGKVNAWPLDEGLIDYVSGEYTKARSKNPLYAANVIANPKIQLGAGAVRGHHRQGGGSCRRPGRGRDSAGCSA